MGLRYVLFRIFFALRKKTGGLRRKFPVNPAVVPFMPYNEWESQKTPFFINDASEILFPRKPNKELAAKAAEIMAGKITFFSSVMYDLGPDYDWITNPDTGYKFEINSHWTDINDFSKEAGDIKYVWEKSRFSFIYTLLRDEHHHSVKHGRFIFDQILDWINKNPINQGPNYKCSQETSLRVLNWVYAIYYYSKQDILNEEEWQRIMNSVYWQMHHVFANINFSRIAVRNNHALTETLALYIVGSLFPQMKDSRHWKTKGKKWFEEEVAYQVYKDGTYLQFSMNYHRVVIQLFSWAIGVSSKIGEKFADHVYERAYKSIDFLFQCQEGSDGELPNYGANDGALFFPLSNAQYRDYRPQLNCLHQLLCNKPLYIQDGFWEEDYAWMGGRCFNGQLFSKLEKKYGLISFPVGGYYLIRSNNSLLFLRCGNHKDRPSQADNLHVDLWVNGQNILVDAGSYKYNTNRETAAYFIGSRSHNTVRLNQSDQMLKGPRFIWYYWTYCKSAFFSETETEWQFTGEISAFRYISKDTIHRRIITWKKNTLRWQVEDEIRTSAQIFSMQQTWHLSSIFGRKSVYMKSHDKNGELKRVEQRGYYSGMYGEKQKNLEFVYETTDNNITTIIEII
jgi:hypothetical protein